MAIAVDPYGVVYKPVPKSACSSVKAGLAMIDRNVDLTPSEIARDIRGLHDLYPTSRFNARQWRRYGGYFRFAVVRDPIRRLLSVYTNRVQTLGELKNARRLRGLRDRFPVDPDPDFFFRHLRDYMRLSSAIRHHALYTFHFTGRDLSLYSKVYRTSDLGDLADDLGEITHRAVDIPRINSSDRPLRFDDLKPGTRDAIVDYLTPEFEHLGALFARPMRRV